MSALSAAELLGRVAIPTLATQLRVRNEPCACGGWILANVDDPRSAVLRHNESVHHRAWWARVRRDWQGEEPVAR